MWGFALFVVVTISALVYSDAKSRGSSSPVLWALGVFFLTIIFLPLYIICRPTGIKQKSYLCPTCGKFHSQPQNYCPHCGAKLFDIQEHRE